MERNDTVGINDLENLSMLMDQFCNNPFVPEAKFDPIVNIIIDMDYETLSELEANDAFSYSFKLNAYCLFMRSELDKLIPKINWCDAVLNKVVSTSWNAFPEFMKYEIRRQSAIEQDTFAKRVDGVRNVISGFIQQIKDKIIFVQKMAENLEQIGKKKSYERN